MVVQQEKDDKKQQELAEKYHDRGIDLCYVDSDFDKALVQLHKAVNLRESILGKYHNDTALSYFRIASVLREEKKSNFEALVVARREFRISQKIIGSPTVSLMTSSDEWKRERMQWIKEVLIGTNAISEPQDLKLYCSQLLQAVEFERVGDRHSNCKEWESAIIQYNSALILETSVRKVSLLVAPPRRFSLFFLSHWRPVSKKLYTVANCFSSCFASDRHTPETF